MKIASNSKVLIPLFHQTSSVFLPSIRDFGLGAVNPHVEFGTYSFMRELVDLASHTDGIPLTKLDLNIMRRMSEQEVTSGNLNFRHGSVYFAAYRRTAISYARNNLYGSELLSESFRLYNILRTMNDGVKEIEDRHPTLVGMAGLTVIPILVVAKGVPISSLRSETGEDPVPELERMQGLVDKLGIDPGMGLWQMSNFELCKPIDIGCLGIYTIVWDDPGSRGLAYRLEKF